ncbi:calcium-activated chloride channel regulator 1 [Folsomia candida]|uniref:calcium-activated chloride channel regulator 1 n=1 Tax=Folsomia candida TaxID=158441 RepID=UPI000B9051A8|nr:calcium-activated chloride channel regulator 1 [Folsomia candida]
MAIFRFSQILGVVLTFVAVNEGFRLSRQGGYDLVLGVNTAAPVPPENDQRRYVQNIKTSMQAFSNNLWRATKRRFHINSVELIVPETWTAIPGAELAGMGSIDTADFRVSDTVLYPYAKNTYLCGLPGDYVELPFTFFQNTNANEFGPIWKTLMVLFARYRYGVWEEHGFIGDELFPYFSLNEDSTTWEATGCNNEPLVGKFINVTDPDQKDCEMAASPNSEMNACRFIPDSVVNKATTSLMHFHFMNSVVDFCDENTHNKMADNKQNAFCNQKSIMQVIRESPDYATASNPPTQVGPVTFKTVKQSANPLLYILLDRGQIQGSYQLANMIPPALAQFLVNNFANVVGAVGSFPNPDNPAVQLKQEVGWSQIGPNVDQFLQAVGELRIDGPLRRDFTQAIMETAGFIKSRGHAQGAVILLVKYGADLDNINATIPENDVVLALNDQKIILHSIELQITGSPPASNLARLTEETTGGFAMLTNIGDANFVLNNVLNFLARTLNSADYISDQATRRTVVKQAISSSSPGIQLVLPPDSLHAEVFYSSFERLNATNFISQIDGAPPTTSVSFRRTVDWGAGEGNSRYSYRLRFSDAQIAGRSSVIVSLNCTGLQNCDGAMVGRVALDKAVPDLGVKIEITTSANTVDLSRLAPLMIYAKATIDGAPIEGMYADALITNGATSYELVLNDDGSIPDILSEDGIFSGYFVPTADGDYRITVRFMKRTTTRKVATFIKESSLGRLLPIDQGPGAGCEITNNCTLKDVYNGFMQVEEYSTPIKFSNRNQYTAIPGKAILLYNFITRTLSWRSPRVPSTTSPVTSYEIRQAFSRLELLNNFDGCEIAATAVPVAPGEWQSTQHNITLYSTYYAIKSTYNGVKSEISNIRRFPGIPAPEPTDSTVPPTGSTPTGPTTPPTSAGTAPTTTTGNPGSTTTTTIDPTAPTVSTTPNPNTTPAPSPQTSPTAPTSPPTTSPPNSSPTVQSSVIVSLIGIVVTIFIKFY